MDCNLDLIEELRKAFWLAPKMCSFGSYNMDKIGLSTENQTTIFWCTSCLPDKIKFYFTLGNVDRMKLGYNKRAKKYLWLVPKMWYF